MTDTNRNDREPEAPEGERIAKVIARAGIASRRDAEAMIAEGRVTLNGAAVSSPAVNVTDADRITVDGEPLPARERTRLWLFHKPRGLVTTARDPEGRPTVFESLPEDLPRVVAIGRLDINTEGLLLLTNDGGLAKVIAHPDTGWMRRYRVRAYGDVTQADLDKLKGGVTVDGMDYGPVEATLDRVQGDNLWITLGLREGKNREVKKILEHLGLAVNRLIRLSFGPFQLGDLEAGLVEEVRTKVLKEQLGQKLASEAGVDFESPVREPIAPFGSEKRMAKGERAPKRDDRRDRENRGDRGGRDGFGGRPHRGGDRDSFKGRDRDAGTRGGAPRGGARGDERPRIAGRPERRPTVWRDGEDVGEKSRRKGPRRDEDPRAARAASAERPRERVGAIRAGEGRKVLVERLVGEPRPERDERAPRRDDRRPAPGGDDRPRRPKPAGGSFGDRPRSERARGGGFADRPPRRPQDEGERFERPRRDDAGPPRRPRGEGGPPRDRDERPRGGFRPGAEREGRPGGGFRSGGAGRGERSGGGFRTGGSRNGGSKGPGGFKGARAGGPKRDGAPGRGGPPGRGG
ncbi:MAG TPA: pseudouridine synthase, partial [Beijerinckiaceae bacterium]